MKKREGTAQSLSKSLPQIHLKDIKGFSQRDIIIYAAHAFKGGAFRSCEIGDILFNAGLYLNKENAANTVRIVVFRNKHIFKRVSGDFYRAVTIFDNADMRQ